MPTIPLVFSRLRRSSSVSFFQTSLFLLGCVASFAVPVHAIAAVHTPGKFSVSDLGAATYTVPIAVPPGTAGVAPSLSVSFNSQANAGLMGRGWSLGGLSSITRCAQTPGQDGAGLGAVQFDANDRFCLDGQKLIVSNGLAYGAEGTAYRTENDSFSKVVSYGSAGGGPAYFKVWTKAGRVLEFGGTADSRIEAQGKAVVRIWALNREQDINSNYLTISYAEDNAHSDFYPVRIDYTGNTNTGMATNNSVRFIYESLPISVPAYKAGTLVQPAARLKHIDAYNGEQRTHYYQMSYVNDLLTKRTRLSGITQCQGDGITCLPAMAFDWQEPGTVAQTAGAWISPGINIDSTVNMDSKSVMPIDLNGDGKTDLLQHVQKDGQSWLIPMYSNGSGFTIGAWIPLGGLYSEFLVADVDGDGLSDLLSVAISPEGIRQVNIFFSTGGGFRVVDGGKHASAKIYDPSFFGTDGHAMAMDIDGDGKAELVEYWNDGVTSYELWISISKFDGSTFGAPTWKKIDTRKVKNFTRVRMIPMDINGDGKMDLVRAWWISGMPDNILLQPMLSNGSEFLAGEWLDSGFSHTILNDNRQNAVQQIIPLDINGDGLTDLVLAGRVPDTNNAGLFNFKLHSFYSDGIKFIRGESEILPGVAGSANDIGLQPDFVTASDINGDGKTDLLLTWYGRSPTLEDAKLFIQPIISQGKGFLLNQPMHDTGQKWATVWQVIEQVQGPAMLQPVSPEFVVLDINGDGKMDLVQQKYKQPFSKQPLEFNYFLPYLVNGGIGDLMTGVTSGLGAKTTIHYAPLTDSATYERDTAASYPYMNVQMPLYVVASVDMSNGVGGIETVKYRYGGLKKDRSRNELTGFRWKEEQQLSTGLTRLVVYSQDWPYTGMVLKSTTSLAGRGHGNLLSQTDSQFGCIDTLDGTPCAVRAGRSYFPFVSDSTSKKWDLNGTVLPEQKITTAYDIWGNTTDILTNVSAGGNAWITYILNTYYPADTSNWLIGQLKRTSVTNTVPAYTGPALPSGQAGIPGGGNGGNNGGATPGSGMQASTVSWLAGFAPPAQASPGRTLALQVQVSGAAPLAGTVTFFDGDAVLAVIALDGAGKASFSMILNGIGTHALRAAYSGDANHAASSVSSAVAVNIDLTPILMLLLDE